MGNKKYNLIIIGAGPAGCSAAHLARKMGKTVLLIEKSQLGGTCLNLGCVPKKLLVLMSRNIKDCGNVYMPNQNNNPFDAYERSLQYMHQCISSMRVSRYEELISNGTEILLGKTASFNDQNSIIVDNETYESDYIMICTGSKIRVPNFEGVENVSNTDEFFQITNRLKNNQLNKEDGKPKVVMIGGGYSSLELASIMANFGFDVQVLNRGDSIMKGWDADIQSRIVEDLSHNHVNIRKNIQVSKAEKSDNKISLMLDNDETIECNMAFHAIGRIPSTEGMGLENAGIEIDQNGAVIIDEFAKTSSSSIYASGDVANKYPLTPVAIREAQTAVENMFCDKQKKCVYNNIPSALFTTPEAAFVGLTESNAKNTMTNVKVHSKQFNSLESNVSPSLSRSSYIKIVESNDKLVGIHMIGPNSSEIIQSLSPLVSCGISAKNALNSMQLHPTSAEEFFGFRELNDC